MSSDTSLGRIKSASVLISCYWIIEHKNMSIKVENLDLLFFMLINHIWVGDLDWNFFLFIMKTEADICHFMICAEKMLTHAEPLLKQFVFACSCGNKMFMHAEHVVTKCLCMLSMR